jgi:asparagine synthase (glutamine-hydrolysing)
MLREMIWHLDEPIGDPVTAGNFALAKTAAEHARWVLNGEGGDPVFGGPKNLPMLLAHWYPTLDGPHAREERYLALWRRAGDEVSALLHPDLRREFDHERDLVEVVRPYFTADRPVHFLNKLIVANMRLKGAHLILPKVDRMLGAHGLTPLSPLFDVDVIRLSLRLPPRTKLCNGVEKWILKRAYEDLLPPSVIARPKSGMRVPVHSWFQRELRREAKALLSPKAVRKAGVFDAHRVSDILKYRTGRDGLRLWMLITFELWRRMVFEGDTP